MSVAGKTAYQLFDIEYTFGQKGNYSVRPLRKSKWHWQYGDEEGNIFFLITIAYQQSLYRQLDHKY